MTNYAPFFFSYLEIIRQKYLSVQHNFIFVGNKMRIHFTGLSMFNCNLREKQVTHKLFSELFAFFFWTGVLFVIGYNIQILHIEGIWCFWELLYSNIRAFFFFIFVLVTACKFQKLEIINNYKRIRILVKHRRPFHNLDTNFVIV